MPLAQVRALVDERIRDTAEILQSPDRDSAIQASVKLYSLHRPRVRVQELTGDGTAHTFALATDWEERFSAIEAIEYPVDKQDPEYLDRADYRLYRDKTTGVLKLRLLRLKLPSAKKAYVSYTARHTVDDTTETVVLADREAVADLATAILATELAAYYAQTSNPTLGADAIDHRSKSQEYLALAKRFEERYRRHVGAAMDGPIAASAIGDLDVELQSGAGDRFFHSGQHR